MGTACKNSWRTGGPARSAGVKRIRRCGFAQEFQTDTIYRKPSMRNKPWLHPWFVAEKGQRLDINELKIVNSTG
jgi:hypothetical protein